MPATHEVPVFFTMPAPPTARKNPSSRAPRYRISLVKEAGGVYVTSRPINDPKIVYEMAKAMFEDSDRESFYAICLDMKNKIIGVNLVSLGALASAIIHPREVFKAAILLNAAKIICAHNHPSSGDPAPSSDDNRVTARLVSAGKLLGIFVIDHVICGESNYYSYQEHGLIAKYESLASGTF